MNALPPVVYAELVEVESNQEIVRVQSTNSGAMESFNLQYDFEPIFEMNGRIIRCHANNSIQVITVEIQITILGKSRSAFEIYLYGCVYGIMIVPFITPTGVPDPIDHAMIVVTPISLAMVVVQFPTPQNNNVNITGYQYTLCQYLCTSSITIFSAQIPIIETVMSSFKIGGLIPNSLYILNITAVNEAGSGPFTMVPFTFNSPSSGKLLGSRNKSVCRLVL